MIFDFLSVINRGKLLVGNEKNLIHVPNQVSFINTDENGVSHLVDIGLRAVCLSQPQCSVAVNVCHQSLSASWNPCPNVIKYGS